MVKGWAAERAAAHLAAPARHRLLPLGRRRHHLPHPRPGRLPWRIGIEDPHDPSRLVAVVPLHTGAVATSGTAHRGAHIVDARTGRPPAGVASVTVIGPSLTGVDIDATAAYALGPDGPAWLAARRRSAIIVRADGTTTFVDASPE